MLRRPPNAGHHRPQEKMKEVLSQPDENKANTDGDIAQTQNEMARQNAAEGPGCELQRSSHCGGDPEHDAEFAVAEIQVTQDQRKYQRLERRLGVVDAVGSAHQGQRGTRSCRGLDLMVMLV